MLTVTLRPTPNSEPVAVSLDRVDAGAQEVYEVHIADAAHEVTVEWHSPTRGCLRLHGRVVPFAASVDGETVHVWAAGRTHALQKVDRRTRRTAVAAAAIAKDEIVAPMPGTILKISVNAGSSFAANESILVMESMKMEMSLSSPAAGRVKEIRCRVGELVNLGAVLAKLEFAENHEPS